MNWIREHLLVILGFLVSLGTPILLIFSVYDLPLDFTIQPEYVTGILTALSVLFGFWSFIVSNIPKDKTKRWQYNNIIKSAFFSVLFLFVLCTILIHFVSVGKYPQHGL